MKNIISALLLLSFSCTLFAQEQMTLEKAISLGLENNYSIKVDEKAIQIAQNNNTWARAGKGPTVDLRGYLNNFMSRDNNPASFLQGTYYNGSLGAAVDANWVLFNGGRTQIAKEQLNLAVTQQELNQKTGIHDLLKQIYQRYYEVLFQQERLEVLKESMDLSRSRLAYEKVKKEFGSSNSYNLLQFENNIISDSTNILSQVVAIELAKRNLYNVLDVEGFANYTFPEKLQTEVEDISEEKLRELLEEENYSLKSLAVISQLNILNSKLEDAARKPVVSINGSFGLSESAFKFFKDNPATGDPFELLWSNRIDGSINGNVSWNLYDGGIKKANIENARIQEEIDQMNFLEAKVELYNQLDILITNYQNQKDLLQLTDNQIQIADRNLEMTGERFKAGTISSIDFRTIQNQYLNAAFNKVNAIYNLILTKIEIDALVGMFSDQ